MGIYRMNRTLRNIIVFLVTIFAIFMGLFGLVGVYAVAIGTNIYGGDQMYFLLFGLMCLAIASTAGALSVKLHYHKYDQKIRNDEFVNFQ